MGDLHKVIWPKGVPHTLDLPDQTVLANLANTVARQPDHIAIKFYGASLTYGELWRAVEQLAGYLQCCGGISKGDRVLLFMQNSPQFVIGYYAILRADAVVVPVNPMNRQAELSHLVDDTGAQVILAGQELLEQITPLVKPGMLRMIIAATYAEMADRDYDIKLPEPLAGMREADCDGTGVVRWREAIDSIVVPEPACAKVDDLAVIPYSSGTTGQPKGCMHTHRTVQATAIGGVIWNPMDKTDLHLVTLPLFHVTGMQSSMNGPLYSGGTMIIMTRWDRDIAAELIRRFQVTRWRSISTMAIDLVNAPNLESYDLTSLKAIGGGGAAMPAAIAKKLKAACGHDYIEGYGMSETMAGTHINPVTAPKAQCLGIPTFEVDSRVLSLTDGQELGAGEAGEIVMRAPQVFNGYWNNPQATEEAFVEIDGKLFLRTGDIGYYDEQGYYFMVDRMKRMINASGFKVWPAEVEALMHRHPDIAEVCVIGTPDERRGEAVKAYIVKQPTAPDTVTEKAIIDWCHDEMAAYKCPTCVAFTDHLPKSGSGKVQWRKLTEMEGEVQLGRPL